MSAFKDGGYYQPDLEEYPMHKRSAGLILSGVLATGAIGAVAMTPQ